MTTYTILRSGGDVTQPRHTGLTVAEAAEALLMAVAPTEIRREADGCGWRLWTPRIDGRLTETRFASIEDDRASAEADIHGQVVAHDGDWGGLEVVTDDQHAEMIAELDAA